MLLQDSPFTLGDHFREIFGPYAGWAHSVSKPNVL